MMNGRRFDVMVVNERMVGGQMKGFWTKIGAAFENAEKGTISIQFDALPISGPQGCRVILQLPFERDDHGNRGGNYQRREPQGQRGGGQQQRYRQQTQPQQDNWGPGPQAPTANEDSKFDSPPLDDGNEPFPQ